MERNVKLNFDKFQLRISAVNYLGSVISHQGMKPDPAKVTAVTNMPTPCDEQAVRRLLGMINFLAPHIPNMANITAPLRDLVKDNIHFQWGPEADSAWKQIKDILSTNPILQFFDPAVKSVIQADASQNGLGACLMQKGKPVAYASRSLSPAERNYAQIEKELLAIVFASTKFHQFIYGFHTDVQTDHKPLESIVKKPLHKISPRLQRMLLCLQKYDLSLKFVKGKYLHVANTLSRALCDDPPCEDFDSDETKAAVHVILKSLPASEPRIKDFQVATETDSQLQQLRAVIEEGWPNNITNVPKQLHQFWKVKEDLYVANNLILMGDRLVIPSSRRDLVLKAVHEGHLGIDKCKARARSRVYWPGINDAIEAYVKKCSVCNTYSKANQKETLLPHPVPMCP